MTRGFRRLGILAVYLMTLTLVCEFVIYSVVVLQCKWPQVSSNESKHDLLRVALISDTHLLGFRNGHWFDKLRREWQMHRAFQALIWHLHPDMIAFLGDLFDEGLWASDEQFDYYVKRFRSLFPSSPTSKMYMVVGNHDIGFHYGITQKLHRRFAKAFNSSTVEMVVEKGNIFILVNSMAMEGDSCFICKEAELKLKSLSRDLKCAQMDYIHDRNFNCNDVNKRLPYYSRPVLLQHFPLYRVSDEMCEGSDTAPPHIKQIQFRQNWDCLSKSSTELLLKNINPRLVFSGHVHYGCNVTHNGNIPEYSVPSFSWRNINNPSAMLLTLATNSYAINKCFLPEESTVINMYIGGVVVPIVLTACLQLYNMMSRKIKSSKKL